MDATRECQRLRYNPTYALQMVGELGAVGAFKPLLEKSEASDRYSRLWELGRPDLTVEAVALRPEFASLFTPDEQAVARQRLVAVGCAAPPGPK
jgi:hypothetical protein